MPGERSTPLPDAAPRHTLVSIQYVRALAALAVVVWHTGWSRTVLGQSGVDAFFVVSGFVMMLVSGRESTPGKFGLSRLLRIVPLYWAMTFVTCAATANVDGLASSLLFVPDRPFPIVITGWSLDLEMMYYLLFAVALCVPLRWRVPALAAEMVILCVALPASFDLGLPLAAWVNPMAFEFLAGAALFQLWQRSWLPVGAAAWLVLVAGVVTLGATHLLGGAPAGWVRLAFWGVPAVAIVGGGLGIEAAGQLPRWRALEALGEASYAIYLTHYLALSYVSGPLRAVWAPVAVALVVVMAIVVGWVVHRGFELPMHRATKRLVAALWRPRSPRAA